MAEEAAKKEDVKEVKTPAKIEVVKYKAGQKVRVHQRIQEGKKERVQIFEGVILKTKGSTPITKTITVYKETNGVGVEKIFPIALPTIEKIEIVSQLNIRKAKLYYLKDYKKKIREKRA